MVRQHRSAERFRRETGKVPCRTAPPQVRPNRDSSSPSLRASGVSIAAMQDGFRVREEGHGGSRGTGRPRTFHRFPQDSWWPRCTPSKRRWRPPPRPPAAGPASSARVVGAGMLTLPREHDQRHKLAPPVPRRPPKRSWRVRAEPSPPWLRATRSRLRQAASASLQLSRRNERQGLSEAQHPRPPPGIVAGIARRGASRPPNIPSRVRRSAAA